MLEVNHNELLQLSYMLQQHIVNFISFDSLLKLATVNFTEMLQTVWTSEFTCQVSSPAHRQLCPITDVPSLL